MYAVQSGQFEHVCLSSEEPETPEALPTDVCAIARLEQAGRRGARLAVVILGDTHLGVSTSRRGSLVRQFVLKLEFLDPAPTRPRGRAWWRVAAVLLGAAAVLGLATWHLGPDAPAGVTAALVATLGAALPVLLVAWDRTYGRWVFLTRHGRTPILELSRRRPGRRSVLDFVTRLQEATRRAAAGASGPQSLRAEMREHRRLLDERVLQPELYEAARGRILAAHG